MNDRLNHVVELLLCDKEFLRRFRRDPEGTVKPLGLTAEEVAAVKRGNARELVGFGLDPKYVWPRKSGRDIGVRLLMRAKRLTPALVLVALAAPASAFAEDAARVGRTRGRSRIARVNRYFGRQGFAGEFHAALAHTGGAGRVTSRAATRTNTSLFSARARNAAREFGIQPPPPPDSN